MVRKKVPNKKSIVKVSTITLLLICGLQLTGCVTSNGTFQCPYKGKGLCKRLDQVNDMVDRGEIRAGRKARSINYLALNDNSTSFGGIPRPFATTFKKGEPLRYGETVLRVWFAPFVDKEGFYHHQGYVDAVVKPGSWIGRPLSSDKVI